MLEKGDGSLPVVFEWFAPRVSQDTEAQGLISLSTRPVAKAVLAKKKCPVDDSLKRKKGETEVGGNNWTP